MTRLTYNNVQQWAFNYNYTVERLTRGYIVYLEDCEQRIITHLTAPTLVAVVDMIKSGQLLAVQKTLVCELLTPEQEQEEWDSIQPAEYDDEPEQGYPDEPTVRRSWGQALIEDGYVEEEPMFTAEEIEARINTLSNEWVQDRQAAGYSVGISNIVKRTPTKVSKRAARFFRELAKAA